MRRKVIQIAESTQLVSLPRKWALRYGVKKGDELEIEEQGNQLVISTGKGTELKKTEINLDGLDRTSILYYIQSSYRIGYDELHITFTHPSTQHHRLKTKTNVISVIHKQANRLIGYEVIQQKDNFCIVKDISKSSIDEFDTVLKRIFLLLKDIGEDMVEGCKTNNNSLLETIEEKHDSVTKFISYCLRLLNKYGHPRAQKTCTYYHIIANLDKIVDVFKYGARNMLKHKYKLKKGTKDILDALNKSIHLYGDMFFNFDNKKIAELYRNRDLIVKKIEWVQSKLPPPELSFIVYMRSMLELITDISEARIGLEY